MSTTALDQTPRIHAEYLSHFISQRVRVVGKVKDVQNSTAQLDSCGNVRVLMGHGSKLTVDSWAEVIGEVQSDLSIRLLATTDFGPNLDEKLMKAAVENWHKYKTLFMK